MEELIQTVRHSASHRGMQVCHRGLGWEGDEEKDKKKSREEKVMGSCNNHHHTTMSETAAPGEMGLWGMRMIRILFDVLLITKRGHVQ